MSDLTLELDGSGIYALSLAAAPETKEHSEYIRGLTLPGLASAHCHAFQRIAPAWTQRAGCTSDDFWTWRNFMYAAAGAQSSKAKR